MAADMTCGCDTTCDTCPPKGYICCPRGDALLVVFSVHENGCDGNLFDISQASDIVFIVADDLGGTVRITKKLSDGDIAISTNSHEFYLTVTSAESASLTRQTNYYECQVVSAGGLPKTVSAGVFKSPDTMIKDIP